MATKPGLLTDWPWTPLDNFKYVILAPWAVHATYTFLRSGPKERDVGHVLILPFLLLRMLHNQIWISVSRHRTATGKNRIVDKGIDFEQVDRERSWDDQIIFNGLLFYVGFVAIKEAARVPFWRTDGVVLTVLLHVGPVEWLYYWLHRALHHHFLYCRYHSHHHSSVATEPITSVVHPFGEHIAYFVLFSIPLLTTIFTRTASIVSFAGYITYIDFMNNLGHCNFELIPKSLFSLFPPLKFFMYTPSTTDKSSDILYEISLKREEDNADVVHLTHLTTLESIYHLRLGFASLASKPFASKWYLIPIWPLSIFFSWVYGHAFVSERTTFEKLKLQSWVIPRFNVQYLMKSRRETVDRLIEEAIVEAEKMGVKVMSLGLLNQGEELNRYGETYVEKYPKMKMKVVDGSSLVVGVVLNNIPKGTKQVIFRGKITKVASAIVSSLCEMGFQVKTLRMDEHHKLQAKLSPQFRANLLFSSNCAHKVWLVGDELSEEEQSNAPKGTLFTPFSQFPPNKLRSDRIYHTTPAFIIPPSFQNMHSCENWLPRMAMSVWHVAGIVHALERWEENECGLKMMDVDKVWRATLRHGFRPLNIST